MATPEPNTTSASSCARSAAAPRSCARPRRPSCAASGRRVQREALVTMRAMIDHYLERLDEYESRSRAAPTRRGDPDRHELPEPAAPRTPTGRGSACPAARRCRRLPELRRREPAAAKFCIECGTALAGAPAAPAPAAEQPPEERRKATILFADLSGYTAVSERLDPERMKSLVDRALRRLGDEIERYGGHDRQVHRRQRDGRLRRPDRPRGRSRARGARRPRDAGGDGRDQRADRRRRRRRASSCGSGSTRARSWRGGSATATR